MVKKAGGWGLWVHSMLNHTSRNVPSHSFIDLGNLKHILGAMVSATTPTGNGPGSSNLHQVCVCECRRNNRGHGIHSMADGWTPPWQRQSAPAIPAQLCLSFDSMSDQADSDHRGIIS